MRTLSLVLTACGGSSNYSATTDITAPDVDRSGDDDDADGTASTPPPETEDESLLRPPAQTDVYVFVANPDRHTVTRIDVQTQSVDTVTVGTRPEIVLTTPDFATAVVFNEGDASVTLLDARALGKRTVDVRENLNEMVLSPDGAFAVLWHDAGAVDPDDPEPDGLQSFNEASFVDVAKGVSWDMAVGFNPRMVRFTPDGRLALVVSDAYLATVDLRADVLAPHLVELEPGVVDPPSAEEVIVAPDGSFAWVRQFGASELLVVDLDTDAIARVPAGDNPTDLDLSPDGSRAVAVARTSAELWVYDAGAPFAPPEVVPLPADGGYGSLVYAPDGDLGVLYTTASPIERFAAWDPLLGTVVERSLVKPVASVAVTPTGGSLLVFHTLTDGPDTEERFLGQWALTLVDLDDFRSNPLLLPAEPIGFGNSVSGLRGYFAMDGQAFFEVVDYVTLLHDQYALRSIPVYVGVLPDLDLSDGDEPPAWVSQEYPLGRISFFDPDDGSLETLTGFELNAGIEE